jgi:hypothetical protein
MKKEIILNPAFCFHRVIVASHSVYGNTYSNSINPVILKFNLSGFISLPLGQCHYIKEVFKFLHGGAGYTEVRTNEFVLCVLLSSA